MSTCLELITSSIICQYEGLDNYKVLFWHIPKYWKFYCQLWYWMIVPPASSFKTRFWKILWLIIVEENGNQHFLIAFFMKPEPPGCLLVISRNAQIIFIQLLATTQRITISALLTVNFTQLFPYWVSKFLKVRCCNQTRHSHYHLLFCNTYSLSSVLSLCPWLHTFRLRAITP